MEAIPAIDVNLEAEVFQACLHEILRFTDRQVNVLVDDGYQRVADLAYWSYEDITKWVANKEKLHNNAGGAAYGDMRKKGLIGLAWWVTERIRTGMQVDLTQFDDEACRAAIIKARVEYDKGKIDSQIDKPNKFKYEDWTEWNPVVTALAPMTIVGTPTVILTPRYCRVGDTVFLQGHLSVELGGTASNRFLLSLPYLAANQHDGILLSVRDAGSGSLGLGFGQITATDGLRVFNSTVTNWSLGTGRRVALTGLSYRIETL
jgi:hypothetical protein